MNSYLIKSCIFLWSLNSFSLLVFAEVGEKQLKCESSQKYLWEALDNKHSAQFGIDLIGNDNTAVFIGNGTGEWKIKANMLAVGNPSLRCSVFLTSANAQDSCKVGAGDWSVIVENQGDRESRSSGCMVVSK